VSATPPPVDALPGLPRGPDGPVFAAPWQAQAFAMVLSLHERGVFTWPEWASALSAQIRVAQQAGDRDLGDTYYQHWLAALEALVATKNITSIAELAQYQRAWHNAAERTVHGAPIVLMKAYFGD
jgi:nitrile hydratase accessory protein